jgi:hypothetical protein
MLRWVGIIVAIALVSTAADAQVFKPKSKKAAATEKSAAPAKKTAKKQPRASATKKRPAKKKAAKAETVDEDEDVAESESKGAGKDYVKIWDDDTIE